jgi:hypothetical protein
MEVVTHAAQHPSVKKKKKKKKIAWVIPRA